MNLCMSLSLYIYIYCIYSYYNTHEIIFISVAAVAALRAITRAYFAQRTYI